MAGVALPGEQDLPRGPLRNFVSELHRLYGQAGKPPLKQLSETIKDRGDLPATLSHEGIRRLLRGVGEPRWFSVEALVRVLAAYSPDINPNETDKVVASVRQLWLRSSTAADEPPGGGPEHAGGGTNEHEDLLGSIVAVYQSNTALSRRFVCNGVLFRGQAVVAAAASAPDYDYGVEWEGFALGVDRMTHHPSAYGRHAGEHPYPALAVYWLDAPVSAGQFSWWTWKSGDRVRVAGLRSEGDASFLPTVVGDVRQATVLGTRGPWWELRMNDSLDEPPMTGAAVFAHEQPYLVGMIVSTLDWHTRRSVRAVSVDVMGHTIDANLRGALE
ncbi:hypothetical protein [Streptomyces europaeiscabiei]|uniref:hypothetical protein n=1 Tax=Streptomyces europaeiscabiei TaxID=146819 RepID=UPI0038F69457